MTGFIERIWYTSHPVQWLLWPFALLFQCITHFRRWILERFYQQPSTVPILVIGNLTVGGVGKTPLVIALAKQFKAKGLNVGIVSRGYGAQVKQFPHLVASNNSAKEVGDEPLLLAQSTHCPVVIAPKRIDAVEYLITQCQCNIILSDDGLQHYRMGRAIEIVVIDGVRGLGNGFCLPAGPLRESAKRLQQVDFVVVNGGDWPNAYPMYLQPGEIKSVSTQQNVALEVFQGKVAAVAAIGNPQRFYATLTQLGIRYNAYSFPDHYQFKWNDLNYTEPQIIMTEKDAVKCRSFSSDKMYYLPVEAVLDNAFWHALWKHPHLQGYV